MLNGLKRQLTNRRPVSLHESGCNTGEEKIQLSQEINMIVNLRQINPQILHMSIYGEALLWTHLPSLYPSRYP
jgi:hypothetical protein